MIHVTDFSEPARSRNETDEDERDDMADDDQPVSNSAISDTTAAPSPDEPLRRLPQQALRSEQDVKTMVAESRSVGHLADLDNEARLAAAQPDYEMPHGLASDFMAMTTSQAQQAMAVNSVPYSRKSVAGMNPRIGRSQARPTMAFHPQMNPRQPQDMGLPDWMANSSPTEMLPVEYSFNGMQCQTHIPSQQAFRMNEAAAMASNTDRDMIGAGAAGLSMVDSMPYQSFPDHSKPLQHRAMSASHVAMLEGSMHDGHNIFYHG